MRLKRILAFTLWFYFSSQFAAQVLMELDFKQFYLDAWVLYLDNGVAASERKTIDVGDLNEPGMKCVPTWRRTVCLVKSKHPVISCPHELCEDETTGILADKILLQNLFEKYPGSSFGSCPGFVRPNPPKDLVKVCG